MASNSKFVESCIQKFQSANASECDSLPRSPCSFYMDKTGIASDADTEPDRSNPAWKVMSCTQSEEQVQADENQVLKEKETPLTLWQEITQEYEQERIEWKGLRLQSKTFQPNLPEHDTPSAVSYLQKHIFPVLCPALEETLHKAKELKCLKNQKCRFSGLDYLSELLWNKNPLHARRHTSHRDIFDIPFVKISLHHSPRPIYPLSWLWCRDEAIMVLQSYIRRYLICRKSDCFEMRQFWKIISQENKEERRRQKMEMLEIKWEILKDLTTELLANAVFEAEWKKHGCKCVTKPCKCSCKCFRWCKCCTCFKIPKQQPEFLSEN